VRVRDGWTTQIMTNPGAVVHAAQLAEDRLCAEIDARRDHGAWTFGGDEPGMVSADDCQTPAEVAWLLMARGIRVGRRSHAKTRRKW
jgi:hypothetical protein